jgi:hypothetical protein
VSPTVSPSRPSAGHKHPNQHVRGFSGARLGEAPEATGKTGPVDDADLVERDPGAFALEYDAAAGRVVAPAVVIGATVAVRTWRLISLGESTTHGGVLLISEPWVGSRATA